ncbi:MAG: response regulator transcription factor [Planctomycetes bacterium]|nr:response regulator transcription factor [Planctomycetota bacterium]
MTAASSQKVARILIVDDHPVMRRGLAQVIGDQPDLTVVAEASSIDEALGMVDEHQPDLMLIDLSLGDGSGIELLRQVREKNAHVRMLVTSMHDETLFAERVLRAGGRGYVHKSAPTETLLEAIRHVLEGGIHLSPAMSSRLLDQVVGGAPVGDRSPVEKLSDRELEVFQMIGEGMITKQIAARLGLSAKTIETYRENIKSKLNLNNAAELTRHAVQWVLEQP